MENERAAHPRTAKPSRQTWCPAAQIQSPEMLHVTGYDLGSVAVVVLVGELDVATAPKLSRYFAALAARRCSHIVVDATQLGFCDCAGLSVLLRAHRRCVEEGGWLRLSTPTPMFAKILRITKLTRALVSYPSIEAACADLPEQPHDVRARRPTRSRSRSRSQATSGRAAGAYR